MSSWFSEKFQEISKLSTIVYQELIAPPIAIYSVDSALPWENPPVHWSENIEELKKSIWNLAKRRSTFLAKIPSDFVFNLDAHLGQIQKLLNVDNNLAKCMYFFVPKQY